MRLGRQLVGVTLLCLSVLGLSAHPSPAVAATPTVAFFYIGSVYQLQPGTWASLKQFQQDAVTLYAKFTMNPLVSHLPANLLTPVESC